MAQLDLLAEMNAHLAKMRAAQRVVSQREDIAEAGASGHWPLKQELLKRDWEYQEVVGRRGFHEKMVALYAAALTATNTQILVNRGGPVGDAFEAVPEPRAADPA